MRLTSKELQQLCGSVGAPPSSTPARSDDDIARLVRHVCDRERHDRVAQWLIESGLQAGKSLTTVRAYVAACLSPKKREKFALPEVLVIMQRSGDFELLMHLNEQCGFERPAPRNVDARLQQVAQRMDRLQEELEALSVEQEWLQRGELMPGFLAPRVLFSRRH